jgi:hypothetical protein
MKIHDATPAVLGKVHVLAAVDISNNSITAAAVQQQLQALDLSTPAAAVAVLCCRLTQQLLGCHWLIFLTSAQLLWMVAVVWLCRFVEMHTLL